MRARRFSAWLLLALASLVGASAFASDTTTFTYDALGRLVQTSHSGTPNSGLSATYTYDPAGNRSNVAVIIGTPTAPSFAINDISATEGNNLVLTVTRSGTTTGSFDVSYTTTNGTAASGSDYTTATGTLTFPAGDTTETITIVTTDDTAVEGAETVLVNLSAATGGATITDSQGVGTINDNDIAPTCPGITFTIASNAAVTEGANSVFTVTKSGTTSNSCSVNYATANGTATAGSDYTAASGTLTFTSAQTSKTFSVATTDDTGVESAETFTASLSSATGGATVGTPGSATATINDNDIAPTCPGITFTIASNAAVTEGASSVFTVTKAGTTANSCSVNYATANGTAATGSDYTAASGTLTFTSAQTSKTVSVATTDDATVESAETFTTSLSSPTGGATVGTPGSATATINDNDGNNPPTPVNDTGTQQKCTIKIYTVTSNDTDPNGDYPLTVTAVTGLLFTVYSSTQIQFESLGSTGNKVGTYTVRDSRGATATATLTVNVSGGICQ